MPSKRGGGSAPSHCKTALRSCMTTGVRGAGTNLRALARSCMSDFNACRSPKGRRKATTTKRKARKGGRKGRR